ncbi:hypothetical protein ACQEVB_05200 [Pseudonocardia sp. CA-107938]|uniref:hypothetical protein n=1 Tax=Pseudonocardia sp. CA-107938 TaxID=3240021 RepID=UPI003D8DF0CA
MSTALWVVFWVLAVFVGSLVFSLLIAAFIRAGGSGHSPDGFGNGGPAGRREPPQRRDPPAGVEVEDEGPDAG